MGELSIQGASGNKNKKITLREALRDEKFRKFLTFLCRCMGTNYISKWSTCNGDSK